MNAPDVIAIGASTGGTRAIEDVLRQLPSDIPGLVIAQHLPASFTRSFAERLNTVSQLAVREARQGDLIVPGTALIAPGGCDTALVPAGGQLRVNLIPRAPGSGRSPAPSVDSLFHSVADVCGADAIGILLTGMGTDGAQGLAAMRDCGALTIAESEETCVVFGMPRAAIERGAAAAIAPLHSIPDLLLEVLAGTATAQI